MPKESTTKSIIYVGKGPPPDFSRGSKAVFHFKATRTKPDGEKEVLDDTKQLKKPFELLIGREFKLPVLEEMVKTMREGEVARFTAIKPLVANYPFVSQAFRKHIKSEIHKEPIPRSHCCGMTMKTAFDYDDLNDFMEHPSELEFVIELLNVAHPESHEKEVWQMELDEKITGVPKLRQEGNELYKQGLVREAAEKYGKALTMLDQLIEREKPGDEEWKELDNMKVPLLANYAQCKLMLEDYYEVIQHSSEVINRDSENVKSYYRRGKAHAAVWNVKEAREDFNKVKTLDPSLNTLVSNELQKLEHALKVKNSEIKSKLEGKLF